MSDLDSHRFCSQDAETAASRAAGTTPIRRLGLWDRPEKFVSELEQRGVDPKNPVYKEALAKRSFAQQAKAAFPMLPVSKELVKRSHQFTYAHWGTHVCTQNRCPYCNPDYIPITREVDETNEGTLGGLLWSRAPPNVQERSTSSIMVPSTERYCAPSS